MVGYEFWLTDDGGNRLLLLKDLFFFSYTRAVSQLGTLQFGLSFDDFNKQINPYFAPDRRVEVWRATVNGLRREDVFMLRKPNVYTRKEDHVNVIVFYGRNGIDLLNRRSVIQTPGSSYATKTDNIDDMMKAVVREQMLYGSAVDEDGVSSASRSLPQGEFSVQADVSLGTTVSRSFAGKSVYDICKELKEASFQYFASASTNRRIFFDVVPVSLSSSGSPTSSPLGWQFRTLADLYGVDRTNGIEFSLKNENIESPSYSLDRLDEYNAVTVAGNGSGQSQLSETVTDSIRTGASRWNWSEKVLSASNEANATAMQDAGRSELDKGKPKEEFDVTFLNIPGGPTTPRSLYGLDWDLGDIVRVNYAGLQFNVEIGIVYVAVDDQGHENITARSLTTTAGDN